MLILIAAYFTGTLMFIVSDGGEPPHRQFIACYNYSEWFTTDAERWQVKRTLAIPHDDTLVQCKSMSEASELLVSIIMFEAHCLSSLNIHDF